MQFMVVPLQASLAVGVVKDGVAVHSIVASAPAALIAGACMSKTAMVWETIAL